MIAILDFGGQYVFNIKRVLNELGVESKVLPFNTPAKHIEKNNFHGIILSGGPYSVHSKNAPICDEKIFDLNVPILGLCYGHQLIAKMLGGKVVRGKVGEYGFSILKIKCEEKIFHGLNKREICWMSHSDTVIDLPKGFRVIASTPECKIAAFNCKNIFGFQFHPEVSHTPRGFLMLKNFAVRICKCPKRKWDVKLFIRESLRKIKKTVKGNAVIGVSGGVDSTVAALLAYKSLGKRLTCVHVNTGFMRKNESEKVVDALKRIGLNVVYVDATDYCLQRLKNVKSMDRKRKIIGKIFVEKFEDVAKKVKAKYLIQGTIAPDVIESTRGIARKKKGIRHGGFIKIHHNVAGLPKGMRLKVVEPLSELFKYQVRVVAKELGLPKSLWGRQPFPGPGLLCRIGGFITKEKVEMLREITEIVEKELERYNPSQYFAMLIDNSLHTKLKDLRKVDRSMSNVAAYVFKNKAVGVKGDERVVGRIMGLKLKEIPYRKWIDILNLQCKITGIFKDICRVVIILNEDFEEDEGYGIIIRAVDTLDFMTASPTKVSFKHLKVVGRKLTNDFDNVKFVGYEITTKPAATIELI